MPALTDIEQPPIQSATLTGRAHPVHPSPTRDGLGLEIMSQRELSWWGQRFGIDTPYFMVPLGWGEWEPVYDSQGDATNVITLTTPPRLGPGLILGPATLLATT